VKAACTIIDKKYIPYARVLSASIKQYVPALKFIAAVVDVTEASDLPRPDETLEYIPIPALLKTEIANNIFKKYAHTNQDHLRWALKPILLLHLLEKFDNVIFVDPDVYFVGDPSFLFEELSKNDALLAPHWSETNPLIYEDGLFSVMRNGLYSGGFIGANRKTIPALEWWAEVCHYKMDARPELGVFVDQKYLDIFPLKLPGIRIIHHPGCNLTNINLLTCKRSIENGELRINKTYKPIFIHFTRDTIYNIDKGNDPLLRGFLDQYRKKLKEQGVETGAPVKNSFFESPKRKFLFRTRLKRFLFRLAEKL
jgi:hypothetical protein